MWKRLDESPFIARLIKILSNSLAEQRGLVPLLGILLVLGGLLLLLVNVFLDLAMVEFFGLLLQGVGIVAALIGLLLAEPLGK